MLRLYLTSLQEGVQVIHKLKPSTQALRHASTSLQISHASTLAKPTELNTLRLFDCDANLTHVHLREDAKDLLSRAAKSAFLRLALIPGSDAKDSLEAIAFAEDISLQEETGVRLFATYGTHPYNARGPVPQHYKKDLEAHASKKRVIAIGECGLDFSDGFPNKEEQLEWFNLQLDTALELGKPLFLHERLAHESFVSELRRRGSRLNNSKILVHCFTGNEQELRTYLDLGFYISVSGLICRSDKEGKRFKDVIRAVNVPGNRLLIETDAPYMQFPGCTRLARENQWKDRPNIPAAIIQVAECLGKVLNRPLDQVCEDSFQASLSFFNISL